MLVLWKKVNMPSRIKISKHKIMLNKTGKLFSHHINDGYNMDLVVGSVVQNPKNPDLWGIKNESDENWVYIRADGTQISLPKGKSAAIIKGAKINFGAVTGEFE